MELQWQIAVVRHRTRWHLCALLCSPFTHYLFSPIIPHWWGMMMRDEIMCISPSLKYFTVSLLHSYNFLKYPMVGLVMPLRPMVILLPLPHQLKEFWWNLSKVFSSNVLSIISVRTLVFGISINFLLLFLDCGWIFNVFLFLSLAPVFYAQLPWTQYPHKVNSFSVLTRISCSLL